MNAQRTPELQTEASSQNVAILLSLQTKIAKGSDVRWWQNTPKKSSPETMQLWIPKTALSAVVLIRSFRCSDMNPQCWLLGVQVT